MIEKETMTTMTNDTSSPEQQNKFSGIICSICNWYNADICVDTYYYDFYDDDLYYDENGNIIKYSPSLNKDYFPEEYYYGNEFDSEEFDMSGLWYCNHPEVNPNKYNIHYCCIMCFHQKYLTPEKDQSRLIKERQDLLENIKYVPPHGIFYKKTEESFMRKAQALVAA